MNRREKAWSQYQQATSKIYRKLGLLAAVNTTASFSAHSTQLTDYFDVWPQ